MVKVTRHSQMQQRGKYHCTVQYQGRFALVLSGLLMVHLWQDNPSLQKLQQSTQRETNHSYHRVSVDKPESTAAAAIQVNAIPVNATIAEKIKQEAVDFFQQLASLGVDKWTTSKFGSQTLSQDASTLIEKTNQIAANVLLRPFPALSVAESTPPKVTVNCLDPRYSNTLTGRLDPNEKLIVDIALFGWDIDFLEIRLLEYGDLIHSFLVPEQNITLKGIPKPFLIPQLLHGRLAPFRDKIDYQPQFIPRKVNDDMYQGHRFNILQMLQPWKMWKMWQIEGSLRQFALERAKLKYSSHKSNQQVYLIQNDGDEIISRAAMAHFKACELKAPAKKVYFPSLSFKRNAAWIQETYDVRDRLDLDPVGQGSFNILKNYLWALGPHIGRLKEYYPRNYRIHPWGYNHMGLGAANHFSTPNHYILGFLKGLSVVDAVTALLEPSFWQRAAAGNLTSLEMRRISFECQHNPRYFPFISLDTLGKSSRQFVVDHLPWAVRNLSDRYPWLYRDDIVETERLLHGCICQRQETCNDTRLQL